ncbi:MAG: hypothetical protein ACREQ4_00400 [Candidatus Binataceae bacterium]
MLKRALLAAVAIAAMSLAQSVVYAQPDPGHVLQGTYALVSRGQVVLSQPTMGTCSVSGAVPAVLSTDLAQFDGNGHVSGSEFGISIGATSCTQVNFNFTGTYTVNEKGDGSYEANGMLTLTFVGRGAACSGTTLINQPFTIIGNIKDRSFTISTAAAGDGSVYAEGPPPGPLTCTAPIANMITNGTGRKVGQ